MKIEILQAGKVIHTQNCPDGNYKIGRSDECEIVLNSTHVSKTHAMLVIRGQKAAIVDTGSSNGIFVNGILVKKQRVTVDDEIVIADCQLRIGHDSPKSTNDTRRAPTNQIQGNLALQMDPEGIEGTIQEPWAQRQAQLRAVIDHKIMIPFYELLKSVDWRLVLGAILVISLVGSVLLSVFPFVRWGERLFLTEATKRAHTVLSQSVRENYRIYNSTKDPARFNIEVAEKEAGMLSVLVIDPKTNAIMAPAKLFNKTLTDIHFLVALKKILTDGEEQATVEKESRLFIVAQPIKVFSQSANGNEIVGVVMAMFEINDDLTSTYIPLTEAVLFALLLCAGAFFFIFKMFTRPLSEIQEQLDAALKGDAVVIHCSSKFPEIEELANGINFSMSRLRQAEGGASLNVEGAEPDVSTDFVKTIEEFDQGTSDALLLIDIDKKVRFVGNILAEVIGMRNQYAEGQNISEACRDQSFAGTVIDLAENVMSSLGQTQAATLDINGISRTMVAIPHRGTSGEIQYILIVVKMGETK